MSGVARVVLVGTDGSDAGKAAVDHAARVALRDGVPLEILHAYQPPYGYYTMAGAVFPMTELEEWRRAAGVFLAGEADRVREEFPGLVDVRVLLGHGGAAGLLVEHSGTAAVTVVGSRGSGGFAGLLLGSVSAQVAAHAEGVVEILHAGETEREGAPVVIGHDGSGPAAAALRFAVGEALARDVPLTVVRFCEPDEEAVTAAVMAETAALLAGEHPGLKVEARVISEQGPSEGLAELSREAGLTVVGTRGRGGFAGLLLGSVSQALLHHAGGPLAVVHENKGD